MSPCCRSTNQSDLPTVTYGDSNNVQVGDAVVAIGNALGLQAGIAHCYPGDHLGHRPHRAGQ